MPTAACASRGRGASRPPRDAAFVIEFTVIGADFQNADQGIGLVYHNDSLVLSD